MLTEGRMKNNYIDFYSPAVVEYGFSLLTKNRMYLRSARKTKYGVLTFSGHYSSQRGFSRSIPIKTFIPDIEIHNVAEL